MPQPEYGAGKDRSDAKALRDAAGKRIREAFLRLLEVVVKIEKGDSPNRRDEKRVEEFAIEMSQAMTILDMYGRLRTINEMRRQAPHAVNTQSDKALRKIAESVTFSAVFAADEPVNVVDFLELPFKEAIEAIFDREPMVAKGYQQAADAYLKHGFALARKTAEGMAEDLQRTEEVQDVLARSIAQGWGTKKTIDKMFELDPEFDENYLYTVAQTNLAGAYVAGREKQMREPNVSKHIVAHIFKSALLPTSRPNHVACDGFIADPDDPLWDYLSPLLGYNCYCRKRPIFRSEAKSLGLDLDANGKLAPASRPPGAEPDNQSFGKRSDKRFYNSSSSELYRATDPARVVAKMTQKENHVCLPKLTVRR